MYRKLMLVLVGAIFNYKAIEAAGFSERNNERSIAHRRSWDLKLPQPHKFWQYFGDRGASSQLAAARDDRGSNTTAGVWQRPHGQNAQSKRSNQNSPRDKRLFSLFTVVKFDNNICTDSNGENGACISPAQCTQRRGTANGLCANGYGVCCTVTASCGQSTSDNNTYFVNTNYPSSFDGTDSCQLTIMKSNPDVCQFRLDFVQFNIRGPETMNHLCTYDQFIVSGATPVSPICGTNDGNHMYIDAGVGQTNPVTLTVVTSGTAYSRSWKIRVSQIPCSTIYRGEEGCLQYHTGVAGQIKSFNYHPSTGLQLSNQDYSICIRMERNFCGIQYMPCLEQDLLGVDQPPQQQQQQQQRIPRSNAFTLTGNTQATQIASMTGILCQTDWLMIPCASNFGKIAPPIGGVQCIDRLCGGTCLSDVIISPHRGRFTIPADNRIHWNQDWVVRLTIPSKSHCFGCEKSIIFLCHLLPKALKFSRFPSCQCPSA